MIRLLIASLSLASLLPSVAGSPCPSRVHLVVIVHPDRADRLTRGDLIHVYLKQHLVWTDGEPIIAVNRESGSCAREAFSRWAFDVESDLFAAYWNELYFQGVLPPMTLSSDAAVKTYVAASRNAIGYVDAESVDDSVRVVLALE